jgi:hypothetical protein
MAWWPLALVAFGGILLAMGFMVRIANDVVEARYARAGVETAAKVLRTRTARERQPVGRRGVRWVLVTSVDYEFHDAGGVVRRGGSRVSASRFQGLREGDTIRVQYLKDDPATSRVVPAPDAITAPWLGTAVLGVGAVVAGLGGAGLGGAAVVAGRRARVVRQGAPYLGNVVTVDEHPQRRGPPRFVLSYRFRDNEGDDCDGWVWLPPELVERWEPGAPILVLWDGRARSSPEPDIFEARPEDLDRLRDESAPPGPPRRSKKRTRKRP